MALKIRLRWHPMHGGEPDTGATVVRRLHPNYTHVTAAAEVDRAVEQRGRLKLMLDDGSFLEEDVAPLASIAFVDEHVLDQQEPNAA